MSFRAALAGAAVLLAAASPQPPAPAPLPAQATHAAESAGENAPAAPGGENAPAAPGGENAPAAAGEEILPIPPVPPRITENPDYDRCLDTLVEDPSGAETLATALATAGATEAAEHCHALAQVELGNSAAGATLLDHLAATSTAPAAARAVVYGQADHAWTMAGETTQAYASASQALALSPDDPDLLIGHAIAGLALQHCPEAASDLTHALELDPKRDDALTLRATARRCLNQLDQAETDIDQALTLDTENPDALLERGIIRQRRGDLEGARADWQHAAELAPDTPTADLAEQNLALLEAGPRQ